MESECKCPMCLATFRGNTSRLPCGHVFCHDCILQTEKQAQNESRDPECPVCLSEFVAATEASPHPASEYHEKLVSCLFSEEAPACSVCGGSPNLSCKDGCGFLCEDCSGTKHPSESETTNHKIIAIIESGFSSTVNHRDCLLHKQPIVSVCYDCWPVTELCAYCAQEDLKTNISHNHVECGMIDYKSLNEQDSINEIEDKLSALAEKREQIDLELKKIAQEEEKEMTKIDSFYQHIIQEAARLKSTLMELEKSIFQIRCELVYSTRKRNEITENVLKCSVAMLQESKTIYDRENITTKLAKSLSFFKKASKLPIKEVPSVYTSNPTNAPLSLKASSIEVTCLQLYGEPYKNLKSMAENLHDSVESLKVYLSEFQVRQHEKKRELVSTLVISRTKQQDESAAYQHLKKRNSNKIKDRALLHDMWLYKPSQYKYCDKVGLKGSERLQFHNPEGIAVHPKTGHLYVTDNKNQRIQIFGENLEFIRTFGTRGSKPGQFSAPVGISISSNGLVAVGEYWGNRVQIFDESDSVIATIQKGQKISTESTQTSKFDGFSIPLFLCYDSEGNLYVVNYNKNRIDKFNSAFEFQLSFYMSSTGEEKIRNPSGICFTSKNEVCVVGNGSERINFYDTGGRYLRSIKIQKLAGFASIAEGPNNTLFVTDRDNHTIVVYDPTNGVVVHTIGAPKSSAESGKFNHPWGLCFGLNQKLYVCDSGNHRIQIFSGEF